LVAEAVAVALFWSVPTVVSCPGVILIVAAGLLACARQTPSPLWKADVLEAVKVADFPGYTEGIAFDATGIGYVSAGRNPQDSHAVYRLLPGKPPERWLNLRIPNGHKVLSDGSHVIAAEGTIVRVARDGRLLDSMSADRHGAALQRPNDIALDGHGGFYFTDPGVYEPESRRGRLLYVDSAWAVIPAADGFCYPNGLVVRADGRALYLDDSCDGRVYRIPILRPGSLGDRVVLATIADSGGGALDGMTLDEQGRIYIAHNGPGRIEVLDSTGHRLAQYPAGNRLASNLAFAGPGLGDLYVTGAPGKKSGPGALYRLRLAVRGRSSMARPAAAGGTAAEKL
jgi:gluconolactonase